MPSAADVLNSASLLVAIVTVLFALWYKEIVKATQIEIPSHLEDANRERQLVEEALRRRAIPLLIAACIVITTFLPVVVKELAGTWSLLAREGIRDAANQYDPSAVALIAAVAFALLLALNIWQLIADLIAIRKRLRL